MAAAKLAAAILADTPDISSYQWSCSDASKRYTVDDPATGKTITTVQAGDLASANAAVEAAQEAFEKRWRGLTRQERSVYLFKAADELQKHADELSALLCLENGKPYKDGFFDVTFLISVFRYFASIVDKLPSELFDIGSIYSTVVYEPHGVCVGIIPFNWPPVHVGGKLAPCLAAGNTMIIKPGEQSPLTAMRIVDILQAVFPPGVVQGVPGLGPEIPQALIKHPLVKMVSLTGSTASGIKAATTAASDLTATALELGGKNAFAIFDDADMDTAVRDTIDGAFFNKGESCTAATRIFVQEKIYAEFVRRLKPAVEKLCTGSGLADATHIGPVVSRERQKQIYEHIERAKQEGAVLAAQGPRPTDAALAGGFYVPPTLFVDVKPSMAVAKDEVFGPVLAVCSFSTEDEVVNVINESEYGLFAGVYSGDFSRAMRVARRLDVGAVLVNNYFRAFLGTPFGGVKGSGVGREHWIGTLREYSRSKNIRFPSGLGQPISWRGAREVCPP